LTAANAGMDMRYHALREDHRLEYMSALDEICATPQEPSGPQGVTNHVLAEVTRVCRGRTPLGPQ
jgi:hypothetical protein